MPHKRLRDAMIEMENAVGALYMLYAYRFPEDAAFWSQLHEEEMMHARAIARDAHILGYLSGLSAEDSARMRVSIQAVRDRVRTITDECSRAAPRITPDCCPGSAKTTATTPPAFESASGKSWVPEKPPASHPRHHEHHRGR